MPSYIPQQNQTAHAAAQHKLSVMYYKGKGVEQNYRLAFEWCRKAANQNHAAAQFNVGWTYYNGEGVKV